MEMLWQVKGRGNCRYKRNIEDGAARQTSDSAVCRIHLHLITKETEGGDHV